MKTATTVCTIFLLFLCSCSENSERESIGNITVDFVWDLKHPQRSPEIHIKNTPKGTEHFHIEFIDATNEWEHGGGSITNDDTGIIRAGALKEFKGLSSTWGTPKIRLSVAAFNKDGRLIGKGEIVKRPPDDFTKIFNSRMNRQCFKSSHHNILANQFLVIPLNIWSIYPTIIGIVENDSLACQTYIY